MLVPAGVLNQGGFDMADLNPLYWMKETDIVTSGSNITSWTNTGSLGSSFDASGTFPQTGQTLNSLPVVDFNNASRLIGNAPVRAFCNNRPYSWLAIVYRVDSVQTDEPMITITENVGTGSRWSFLAGTGGTLRIRSGGRRVDGSTFSSAYSATSRSGAWYTIIGIMDWQGAICDLWVDGVLDTHTTGAWGGGSANCPANDSANVWLGQYANSTNYADIMLAEMVGGGTALSQLQIDQLTGYLAHKWALTANLPAEHPYKSNPP